MSSKRLKLVVGDNKTISVSVEDKAGQAVSLTGGSVRFTLKASDDSVEALIEKSSSVPTEIEIMSAPDDNSCEIKIVPTDTRPLTGDPMEAGTYVYDVEVTLSSGEVHTVLLAQLELLQDISI